MYIPVLFKYYGIFTVNLLEYSWMGSAHGNQWRCGSIAQISHCSKLEFKEHMLWALIYYSASEIFMDIHSLFTTSLQISEFPMPLSPRLLGSTTFPLQTGFGLPSILCLRENSNSVTCNVRLLTFSNPHARGKTFISSLMRVCVCFVHTPTIYIFLFLCSEAPPGGRECIFCKIRLCWALRHVGLGSMHQLDSAREKNLPRGSSKLGGVWRLE